MQLATKCHQGQRRYGDTVYCKLATQHQHATFSRFQRTRNTAEGIKLLKNFQ